MKITQQSDPVTLPPLDDVRPPQPPTLNREMRRKLARLKVGDLMSQEFAPQKFVVAELLPVGLCMLAGAPKMGKSWAALDLCVSVAAGRPFLGRQTDQGSVLYLALEDTQQRLQSRLELIGGEVNWADLPLELAVNIDPINAGGLEALCEWLENAEDPRLIAIDVWGRFSPRDTTQKNEYDQITHTLQPLQQLAQKYGICILVVHHTKKSNGDSGSGGDPFDQVMGSRALTSNMDATLLLTRSRMKRDAVLATTGRDVEEMEVPITFNSESYRWEAMEQGQPTEPPLSPARQEVLDAVAAGHTKTPDIVAYLRKGRTAVANLLKHLVEDGHLRRLRTGEYALASTKLRTGVPDTGEVDPVQPGDMNDTDDTDFLDSPYDMV